MKKEIIIIAIVRDTSSKKSYNHSAEMITKIFETESITNAIESMNCFWIGYEIEYLYVFDSKTNQKESIKFLIK